MTGIDLSVVVNRDALALAPLDLNDGIRYGVSRDNFLGGQVSFKRNQITSAWMHGAVTVNRVLQQVTESLSVEVYGRSRAGGPMLPDVRQTNEAELVAALIQDNFVLTVIMDGVTWSWQCEAADYKLDWTGPRLLARQGQVVFSMPRQPVALAGGV